MFTNCTYTMKPPISVRLNKAHTLSEGLVGWWGCQSTIGGKVHDCSGNLNHATSVGNVTFVSGKFGQAGDFPGTADYLAVSTAKMKAGSGTLNAWVFYHRTIPGAVSDDYLFARETAAGERIILSASKLDLHYVGIGDVWTSTGVTIVVDVWMMITLTWDGTNYRWYKNGAMLKGAVYGNLTTVGLVILIAGLAEDDVFSAGYCFDGLIDDVQMYDRPLSASEVQELWVRTFANFGRKGLLGRMSLSAGLRNDLHS